MSENYYDGAWRPVTDLSDKAMWKLRDYGFEFGADKTGHLMARWPVAPAAPALTFDGIPLEYWRGEVALGCAVSLARLKAICQERGCDYEMTIRGLK